MDELALIATSREYNRNSDVELIKLYVNQYGDCFLETPEIRQDNIVVVEESLTPSDYISTYIEDGFCEVSGSIIGQRFTDFLKSTYPLGVIDTRAIAS